jgi:ATP-dependent Clp protease protease subunit
LQKIEQDTERDRFMSADEAVGYGLIDRVVESMPRVETEAKKE